MTLTAGTDFTITTTNVHPSVAGASRREAHLSIPFTNMTQDTWFVVVVKGTDGVSRPMFPVHPADLAHGQQRDARQLDRRQPRRERRHGARLHERALRRRRRDSGIPRASRTVRMTATAAVLLGIAAAVAIGVARGPAERERVPSVAKTVPPPRMAAAVATSAPVTPGAARRAPEADAAAPRVVARDRPPAVGGVALVASAVRAQAVVAGIVAMPTSIDTHGWRADLRVDRVLLGTERLGDTLTIAWEELSPARQVRFQDGERVLVVLDPLPTQSLWRKRFPRLDPAHPVLVVASGGDAFLGRPDGVTIDVLEHYLAMAPAAREGAPGAARLADLVRGAHPAVAAEALALLAGNPARADLLDADGADALLAAARSSEREVALREAALRLAAQHRMPGTRETALALTGAGSPIRAEAYRALATLPDGLAAEDVTRLLADADPEVRVVGIESAGDAVAAERLVALAHDDPAPAVRLAAGRARLARRDRDTAEGAHAIAEVLPFLDDPDAGVRTGIAESLGALGADAVGPLAAVVDNGSERAALAAILGLARAGPQGGVILTSVAKAHDKEAVRAFARLALGEAPDH